MICVFWERFLPSLFYLNRFLKFKTRTAGICKAFLDQHYFGFTFKKRILLPFVKFFLSWFQIGIWLPVLYCPPPPNENISYISNWHALPLMMSLITCPTLLASCTLRIWDPLTMFTGVLLTQVWTLGLIRSRGLELIGRECALGEILVVRLVNFCLPLCFCLANDCK